MEKADLTCKVMAGFVALEPRLQASPFAGEVFAAGVDYGIAIAEQEVRESCQKRSGEHPDDPVYHRTPLRPDPTLAPPRIVTDVGEGY